PTLVPYTTLFRSHQLGPGPREAGPELCHEMPHARFAARNAIDLEHPHLGPAQTERIAHDIVQLFNGADAVLDQPKRFTPHRLKEAITDKGFDLLADHDGLHADRRIKLLRLLNRIRGRLLAANYFDQRQEIAGVDGMRDDQPLRIFR